MQFIAEYGIEYGCQFSNPVFPLSPQTAFIQRKAEKSCKVTKNRVGEKRSGFVPAFVLLGMMFIWLVDMHILGNIWLSCWL